MHHNASVFLIKTWHKKFINCCILFDASVGESQAIKAVLPLYCNPGCAHTLRVTVVVSCVCVCVCVCVGGCGWVYVISFLPPCAFRTHSIGTYIQIHHNMENNYDFHYICFIQNLQHHLLPEMPLNTPESQI